MSIIVTQRPSESFSPVRSLSPVVVTDDPGDIVETTHRNAVFNQSSNAAYHKQYVAGISNGETIQVISDVPDSVDVSAWPVVKRQLGIDSYVNAQFTNGRATSSNWLLDFNDYGGQSFNQSAHASVADSLLEYTVGVVEAIANAMTSNMMWNASGNRAQTSVIPHQFFTGQVWNGKWGGGAGLSPASGRRFMAITPRHLYACGHYQYNIGDVLEWKDINNNIIQRTVLGVVNLAREMYDAGEYSYDMSITLLNADLPESITILPVIGPWATGMISSSPASITFCQQIAGLALLNNDGHLNPFIVADTYDNIGGSVNSTFEGIDFTREKTLGVVGYGHNTTLVDWGAQYPVGTKFYHALRGGDSGSPCVVPCAEGWAYSGHISQNYHPTPALFNELIALIDDRYGVTTGHTVTVATDPTL